MSAAAKAEEARLRQALAEVQAARRRARLDPQTAADRLAVREYQRARIAATHADLLADPATAPAARFFLDELYTTADLSQRDADIERVIKVLVRFLPESALATLADALEIDALAESLDHRLAELWREHYPQEIELTPERYAELYRRMGHGAERERQLALTEHIGHSLCRLVRVPLLRGLLRMMRGPAHAAGVGALHDFLEKGYASFAALPDARQFVATIVERERAENARLIS